MAFQFFTIPIASPEAATNELNAFLRSHRILKTDRQWVDQGTSSLWSVCVEYLDGAGGTRPNGPPHPQLRKVDYKDTLSPADFAVFAKLREVRKAISQAEAVPVYAIFTNEQLAQMVSTKATSRAALGKIEGVGGARLDKYGPRMLDILSASRPNGAVDHEAGGKPV
jgi:superfamily II DNA helicase RecQ